jgi:hypothetical protein
VRAASGAPAIALTRGWASLISRGTFERRADPEILQFDCRPAEVWDRALDDRLIGVPS